MGFSVANTLSLRLFYTGNTPLATSANRQEATTGKLSMADSKALKTAVRRLQDYKFDEASEEEAQQKLRAFVDTYNNTLLTGGKYAVNDSAVKNAVNKMKSLSKENADTLADIGITVDSSTGYMKVSDTAVKNITRSKFTDFFSKDNDYLNGLYSAARHMVNRVDIRL